MEAQATPWMALCLAPVFWILASVALSVIGGWSRLASVYRATIWPEHGYVWKGQSGAMRFGTHYGGCLNIAADQNGLYLKPFLLFRIGHPPLFIPWNHVAATEKTTWFMKRLALSFRDAEDVPVVLSGTLGREILTSVGEHARIRESA
ncbi:MAG: hypothetical protein WA208_01520 [Thermoanaerobaculia bacterium]